LVTCKSDQSEQIKILFTNNHRSLKIIGLDYAATDELKTDTTGAGWQKLVPVYRMPNDTNLKDDQPAQPGKYRIMGTAVIFTPDTPFLKNQLYFVRNYEYQKGANVFDAVKKRRKIGRIPYTDLIFRY
jgi:hypothetical protein